MPPARSSTQPRAKREQCALVDALDAAELKRLLVALLDAHPELVAEAAVLADGQLGAVTVKGVAEEVAFALGLLEVESIWERSGSQPGGA